MSRQKIKLYVSIPTMGTVVDTQAYTLREIENTYKDYVEFVYPFDCIRRCFHDHARNKAIEDFLASDCDAIWFLDSDITPAIQVMDLVAIHWDKWKVAGLAYPIFMTQAGSQFPEVLYTAYEKNPDTGNFRPTRIPTSGTALVDGLATGCLFIKREVFKDLKAPWMEFRYDATTRDITEGEDLGFVRKVSALGHKFFTDYGVPCRHQKTVDLLDVNNYAMIYAQNAVNTYDSNIQKQVVDAIRAAHMKGYQEGLQASKKASIIHPSNAKWAR